MTGANLGAIVGGIMLPGVGIIVGGIVGGMVSSILSGSLYNELQKSINSTELSNKQREQIKAMCANLIEDERRYREEMIEIFDQFFDDKEKHIRTGFESISDSIKNQDSIHSGLGMVADALGLQLAFNDIDDFRKKVASGKAITI
jgi:transcriptional regulator of heat shock response